jgi:hypothetical protein
VPEVKSTIKARTILVDVGNEALVQDGDNVVAVPTDDSWLVVPRWANVIIVDNDGLHSSVSSHYSLKKL